MIPAILLAAPEVMRADVFYVANRNTNSVTEYSASGTAITVFTNGLNSPTGVALDRFGNLYDPAAAMARSRFSHRKERGACSPTPLPMSPPDWPSMPRAMSMQL
jgi:hypothetical protein